MNDIYFHVGLHKTGTTFLQHNVFPNIKGIDYYATSIRKFKFHEPITQKTLVSRENFSGNPWMGTSPDDRRANLEVIKHWYSDAKIIVFIREDKIAWVESLYSTYIKGGGTFTYEDWFNNVFHIEYLDYGKYITMIKKLFKNHLILSYEDFRNDNDYSIRMICNFMNVSIPEYTKKVVGRRLSPNMIKVYRLLNNLPIKRKHINWMYDKYIR